MIITSITRSALLFTASACRVQYAVRAPAGCLASRAVRAAIAGSDAVIIVHGTDTLVATGKYLHASLADKKKPIILTGAMRPYEFRDTDATQNVTEALFACGLLEPGVWVVMHGRALRFPGVTKDRKRMTFVRACEQAGSSGTP